MAKKAIVALTFTLFCNGATAQAEMTAKSAMLGFEELYSYCTIKVWGEGICGPTLFIDPETRSFLAYDPAMGLPGKTTVEGGKWPENASIANTSVNWNNMDWAMLVWPLPADKAARSVLLLHENYHRIQKKFPFYEPYQQIQAAHLDTYEGRVSLRKELVALLQALETKDPTCRRRYAKLGLKYRKERLREAKAVEAERQLNLNEGLAEYWAQKIALGEKQIPYLTEEASTYEKTSDSFVRSFSYQLGPLWGVLLDLDAADWARQFDASHDLADLYDKMVDTEDSFRLCPEITFDDMIAAEKKRETESQLVKVKLKEQLVTGPVLSLPSGSSVTFDPRTAVSLEGYGTVYQGGAIQGDWGTITVQSGANLFVSDDWSQMTVSAAVDTNEALLLDNKNWTLSLSEGWKIHRSETGFLISKQK